MDHNDALDHLDALGHRPDLDVLERTADALERTLRSDDPAGHPRFVLELCGRLNSYEHGDWERQDRLVRKYAGLALHGPVELPVELELPLLEHLVPVAPTPSGDQTRWRDDRRELATRWLRGLARLDQERDPDFDLGDVPAINVAVPEDVLPAGVAAEHVQDPALRRRYLDAVAANQAHSARYARQLELLRLAQRYRPVVERHLAAGYAQPPDDLPELRRLLAEQVSDADWRAALEAAVERRRQGDS
ncbi:hypothetical protein [Streptomyces sp. NPDC006739]|uniref:hypothetical protein n=1 Tax=Streptomyces sp. NPDC006739 TaxID=3364763 RepID=UPI003679F423